MPVYTTTLPNGQSIRVMGPTGASPEAIQQAALQIAAQRTPALSPDSGERNYSLGTAASKGFSRGTERIKSAFGDVIPAMVGDALGFDEYAAKQMKEAQASQELVNRKYRAELQSYKDVQGIGDAIKFGIETVSEQIPNLATMVVPGIGAGQIARVGASKLAATELAKRQATAQGIGVYMGSYALNTPEVFQNIYDETGELATGTAILFGAAAAALDSVLPSAVLKNITPFQKSAIAASVLRKSGTRPGITKSVLTGIGKGSGAEGLTEAAQEAISISAENFVGNNPQIFDSEDWDRIMESAVRGAVAGGTFRGISEPFGRSRAEPKNVEDLTQSDVLDENIKIAATADVAKETAEENMKKAATAAPLAEVAKAAPAAEVTPKVEIVPNRLKTLRKNNLINQQAAQAAELGLEIQEDGTATRFETVDPQDETAGEQEVTYKIINNRWERQDESTTIDAIDGTEGTRESDGVPVEPESLKDAPAFGESDRGEVGVDTNTISSTGGGENVSDAALTDKEKVLKNEIARKYLPRIEEAREKLRPIEEAEDAKVRGDQAATYKLMAKQEARRQKAFKKINDEGMAEFEARRKEAVSDAALSPENITAEQQWDEMSVSGVPFSALKKEDQLRLSEARQDAIDEKDSSLGITRELVNEIDASAQDTFAGITFVKEEDGKYGRYKAKEGFIDKDGRPQGGKEFIEDFYRQDEMRPVDEDGNVQESRTDTEGVVPTFEGKEIPQSLIDAHIKSERATDIAETDASFNLGQIRSAATRLRFKLEEEMEDFLGLTFEQYQTEIEKPRDQDRVGKLMRTLDNILRGEPVGYDYMSQKKAINTVNYKIDRSLIDKARKNNLLKKMGRGSYLETKDVKPIQESRTETEGTGQTAATITTELVEEFGNNVNKMIEKGKLVIVDNVSQLPDNVTMSSTANGAYDPTTQTSYIVANRIQKGQARRVLLHEIGEHYGLEKMVGKDYMPLLNRLKTLRKQNAEVQAIFDKVQEQYPELEVDSKPFLQEVMAKVGESAPNNTLFRRMVGAVKNFLRRLGLYNVNNFNDADIQDMILNSLRVSLAEATGTVTREQASGIPALQMSKEKLQTIAGWKPERITKFLKDYNNVVMKNYGTYYVALMSPQQFLDLAQQKGTPITSEENAIISLDTKIDKTFNPPGLYNGKQYIYLFESELDRLRKDMAKAEPNLTKEELNKKSHNIFWYGSPDKNNLKWNNNPIPALVPDDEKGLGNYGTVPFLQFEHPLLRAKNKQTEETTQSKITGHEGRHRARALQRLGVTQMAVFMAGTSRDQTSDKSARIEIPDLKGKSFKREGDTNIKNTVIENIISIEPKNEAAIREMIDFNVNPEVSPNLQFSKEAPSIIDLGGVNVQESRAVMDAINPTIQNFKNADTAVGNFIFSNLSKIPDAAANLYVRFLSIPNKIELFGKQIPGLETILNALQGKANEIKQAREEVNRTIKIGQEILSRYSEEVQTEWNTILLELSRQNVNPETIINDPEARAELERPVGKDNAGNQFYNDKAIDLVARYEQLPKDLRDLAKLLVSDLKLKYDTLLETMIATYPGAEAQLRERFASLDYYLPMVRKGNFWFKYIDKNGEEASSSAETSFLRERMKKKLAEEGAKKFEDFTQAQLAAVSGRAPSEFVENLKAVFETSELGAEVKQSIVDTIEDQYLALFPEQSLRNQESHRRGVPGYINDVLFAYGETAPKIIASTANAKYNTGIVAAANQVSSETKDSTSAIVRAIGKDTINTTPFYLNPVANIFASMPAYLSYVWFIGGNISSAFVNLTQLPLIVLPFLQGEYGFDESQKALFDAIKMYSNGGFEENRDFLPDRTMAPFKKGKNGKRIYRDKEFAPNGKYHQLFKDAEEAAALRRGVGYEITELRKSLGAQVKSGAQWQTKAEAAVGYVFQNSERLNREVTLVAAFNLAKSKGMTDKDAIQKAIDLTSKVHSHALPEVGPSLFQDGLGKVTFVFKRFAQAQVYLVSKLFKDVFATKPKTEKERKERDIARNQLLGVYGYSFLMAGVQGMPFYGGATILASLLFDDEDDPFDPHTAVNQAIGNIAYRGPLSAVLGVDISQRTGFRDLVFREDPARLEKIGASAYMLEVIGGPGYSIARRGFEGIEMIGNGEIGRGAERILPTAVGNALKTVRYNTDGMTNRYGAPIIEGNPSVYESFMQILGFSNIELSEAYTESNALKGPERKLQKRRSQLLLQYFLAKQTGDVSGMKSIQKDINRFNSKAPRSFKLTPSVMNKSFKARTERVKNSVQGTYISSKRRADLEDKYLPD